MNLIRIHEKYTRLHVCILKSKIHSCSSQKPSVGWMNFLFHFSFSFILSWLDSVFLILNTFLTSEQAELIDSLLVSKIVEVELNLVYCIISEIMLQQLSRYEVGKLFSSALEILNKRRRKMTIFFSFRASWLLFDKSRKLKSTYPLFCYQSFVVVCRLMTKLNIGKYRRLIPRNHKYHFVFVITFFFNFSFIHSLAYSQLADLIHDSNAQWRFWSINDYPTNTLCIIWTTEICVQS